MMTRRMIALTAVLWLGWTTTSAQTTTFNARPANAPGGRAVFAKLTGLSLEARERRIAKALERGNVPAFLRKPVVIRYRAKDGKGRRRRVALRVMADYLAIGSTRDFVRVPLTPGTARRIADRVGLVLPTRRIVDLCHEHATTRLAPRPMTERRTAVETFLEHHDLIEAARRKAKHRAGTLLSGIKKDVVVSKRVEPGKVAIYGWHRRNGKPIQPLYAKHAAAYVDYSHGIRLVWPTVTIDGKAHKVRKVMADPVLSTLLSDEGVIADATARYGRRR